MEGASNIPSAPFWIAETAQSALAACVKSSIPLHPAIIMP
jgi:hypothetical protein